MRGLGPQQRLGALPTAAGVITRLAFARIQELGIEPAKLLKQCGLTAPQIADPRARLGAQAQIRFLELAADALQDALLGFHLARDFDLRQAGLLYYVGASSSTLGDALRRSGRYSRLGNEGVSILCVAEENVTVGFHYVGITRYSDRQQIEFWITALIRLCRQLTNGRVRPASIRFAHRREQDGQELSSFLGCRVEFGAATDEIVFPASADRMHVVGADPYLNDLLIAYCEEALARAKMSPPTLRIEVENAMNRLLPHGEACAENIARAVGMSRRTLARRLAAEGLTLTEILEDLRVSLARRYLREKGLSISQIAWLLGYREVAAFTNAFRRWTGRSPTEARNSGKTAGA